MVGIRETIQIYKNQVIAATQDSINYKKRIDKAIEYIEKYLHEHVIDDLPDEESKFELENGTSIPNAKEVLLNILKGED